MAPASATLSSSRTATSTAALRDVVGATARAASTLGTEMADIAGTIDDTMHLAQSQARHFAGVGSGVAAMVIGNEAIRDDARKVAESARDARDSVVQALGVAVDSIESGLASVGTSLDGAIEATNEIARIALQTRMVALNASVQAAHAGSGGGAFAVVADAVRELAEKIRDSSKTIASTLAQLTGTVHRLASRDAGTSGRTEDVGLRSAVDASLAQFRDAFADVVLRIENVAQRAESNLNDCGAVDGAVRSMAAEVAHFEQAITEAARKSGRILSMSERLIKLTADSGAETDPQQFMSPFVPLTDRLFTPVQESVLEWCDRVAFCAAVDRNGFLPTHNLKFSRP